MWQNNDNVNHSVRSGVPGTPTTLFNSGVITPGNKFYFSFSSPGTFPFFSELDAGMTGTITVQ
jgi:plastocyanin